MVAKIGGQFVMFSLYRLTALEHKAFMEMVLQNSCWYSMECNTKIKFNFCISLLTFKKKSLYPSVY